MKQRSLVFLVASLFLLCSIAPSAAATQTSPDVYHVYDDAEDFRKAAMAAQGSVKHRPEMSEAAQEKRRKIIASAVERVSLDDRLAMAEVAAEYGLVILNSNLKDKGSDSAIMSSSGDLRGIRRPVLTYDRLLNETGFYGVAEWNSAAALMEDARYRTGAVGGHNAAGLTFSNISQPEKIRSWWATGYDVNGARRWTNSNPTSVSDSNGNRFAVIFQGQDNLLGLSSTTGWYDWWKVTTWVWIRNLTDTGNVAMTYTHTWDTTQITGYSINTGVPTRII